MFDLTNPASSVHTSRAVFVEMSSISASGGGGAATGMMGITSSPFTVSQWEELEHQALIFKYMVAGLPVPPDLLLPIQKSFESISQRFFHHPAMSYCSFYGKKVDPEPGRCRRTDGKKWRCSKEAYSDSKYCERHMHRGRNRSRKPVESHSHSMTQSSATVTSLTVTGGSGRNENFQNLSTNAFTNPQGTGSGTYQPQHNLDSISYGIPSREYRYLQGLRSEGVEHSFISEASESNRFLQMESPMENTLPLMTTRVASNASSKSNNSAMLQSDYPRHSFLSGGYASGEPVKLEGSQSLRPLFDEWPGSRESWSRLEDERSKEVAFFTTQLSISIPVSSSDFSVTRSQSPNGEI